MKYLIANCYIDTRIGITFFVFVINLFCAQNLNANQLHKYHYTTVKKIALDILSYCPPEKCVSISVGRSMELVRIFIDNFLPGNSYALPLSSESVYEVAIQDLASRSTKLTQNSKKTLFHYFDKQLPSVVELKGRSVMLMDFGFSGGSLRAAEKLLQEYYEVRGQKTKVRRAIIYNGFNPSIMKDSKLNTVQIPLNPMGSLEDDLLGQRLDAFAEYESFNLSSSPTELPEKVVRHDGFKRANDFMRSHIENDSSLKFWRKYFSIKDAGIRSMKKNSFRLKKCLTIILHRLLNN